MSARCSSAARVVVVLLLGAAAYAAPTPALAQLAADDAAVAALDRALRPGDKVTIALPGDARLTGRFILVSPEFLAVQTNEGRREVPTTDVQRVRRTRMGFLAGPVIGALAGLGLGLAAYNALGDDMAASGWMMMIGVGAGVGLGIDAAINLPRTVYERDAPRVSVAPVVTPRGAGVGLKVRF